MSANFINLIFIALLLMGSVFFWWKSKQLNSQVAKPSDNVEVPDGDGYSLIAVSVPKNNDRTPLAAEQMFAALHGVYREGEGEQPRISCEVVSKNQSISFFIYAPSVLRDFVLSQVYAQYPNVDVKTIPLSDDYAQIDESKNVVSAEISLLKPTIYPIKTFQNFEVDPLSAITGVLSSSSALEEVWVQLVVRPIADTWQEQGDKEIKNIKEPPAKAKGLMQLIITELITFGKHFLHSIVVATEFGEKKEEKKDDKKELTGPVQQAVKAIEEKITKLGFETTIRVVAAAPDQFAAKAKLEQVIGAYKQFNSPNMNSFIMSGLSEDRGIVDTYRNREMGSSPMIFNISELASLYHFPSESVSTPTIAWSGAKKGEPPANLPIVGSLPDNQLTVFAKTNFRTHEAKFGIKLTDRRLHTYIIGKTGTGKSTLMENMIYDDIREGRGLAVVDPHGELIEHVLDLIPKERMKDVVYFNPADYNYPVGFNVLESVNPDMKNIIASGVVGIFKKIFGESWGPRLEYILRNAILALLDYPNSTLLGVMRILSDTTYRRSVLNTIKDPVVRDFFVNEYEKYEPKFRQEAIAPIQNKVGQFTSSSTIRNIIGQPNSKMNIRDIMDSGKILLANLSTGRIGEDNSALLGAMLITKIQLAAMGRTDMKEDDRLDFYLYVDEFQNFATDSFATILSEARKYHLNLVMINQYISQMPETVANAVFGNVGTMISFRVGAGDAEALKSEFEPVFDVNDLVNQPNRHIYLKMAIDGVTVPAFSAGTLPPPAEKYNLRDEVVEMSRATYGTPRSDVEDYIADWSEPVNLSQDWKQGSEQKKTNSFTDQDGGGSKKISDVDGENILPTKLESDTIKTQSTEAPKSEIPKIEERGVEAKSLNSNLVGKKMEILQDRFDKKWYAITSSKETVALASESLVTEPASLVSALPETMPIQQPLSSNQPVLGGENTTGQAKHSGGEETKSGESDLLITWEDVDQLGLNIDETVIKRPKVESDDLMPIDEL